MEVTTFVVFASLLAVAVGVVVPIKPCEELPQDQCSVQEVRINPCHPGTHCGLKKGTNVSMEFDFTPNFSTDKLKNGVYWPSPAKDVPFPDFHNDDACTLTSCPTVTGQQQVLNYTLYIGKKLPRGVFMFKWKIWNENNVQEVCCFQTTINLKK